VTLIVALQHDEGIVLASDSQGTMQASQPVKQHSDKLHVLGGSVGWGGSGSGWLIARVRECLENDGGLQGILRDFEKNSDKFFRLVNKLQREAHDSFVPQQQNPPQEQEQFAGLFGGYMRDGHPFLFEIDVQGHRGFHPRPYAAIGSGTIFAAHALVSVSHFDVKALSAKQAHALAYRTVQDAINTAAYGIGGKVQMCAVTRGKAWCLSAEEIKAVQDLVDIWKSKEVETLGSLALPANAPSDGGAAGGEDPPSEQPSVTEPQ
jgi:20S proteasome alpha/beta subunit